MTRFAFGLLMAAVVSIGWFFLAVWLVVPVLFVTDAFMQANLADFTAYLVRPLVYLTTLAAAFQGFFLGMWLMKNE